MTARRREGSEGLLRANREFYRAFAAGDFVAMDRVWAEHRELLCVHPGWAVVRGRDRVMASWRGILRRPMSISARDAVAELLGEVGIVTCTEVLAEGELVATNVFVREQGHWRLIHHHAGLVARQRDDDDEDDDGGDDGGGRLLN
jgi:ketosteroid isomerase-like protein